MDPVIYEVSGTIWLTHEAEELPAPDPEELAALEADAARLGYSLKRLHSRRKLRHYINSVLAGGDHEELKSVLYVDYDGGRSYREFDELSFTSYRPTLDQIKTVFKFLPDLIRALKLQENIDTEVDLSFADRERRADSIKLTWADDGLQWTESSPSKPITEAELYRMQRASWLKDNPERAEELDPSVQYLN